MREIEAQARVRDELGIFHVRRPVCFEMLGEALLTAAPLAVVGAVPRAVAVCVRPCVRPALLRLTLLRPPPCGGATHRHMPGESRRKQADTARRRRQVGCGKSSLIANFINSSAWLRDDVACGTPNAAQRQRRPPCVFHH